MPNPFQNCCVCIATEEELIHISASDTNQVQWSSKLNKCVPEVDWSYDCFLCPNCIQKLEVAYTFYNLCLQSYEMRKQQTFAVKIKSEETPVVKDETLDTTNKEEFMEIKTEEMVVETNSNINISSSDEEYSSSEEVSGQVANTTTLDSLPVKSRPLYVKAYAELYEWIKKNTVNNKCITENLLLAYFSELSEAQKSSSLLSKYSMLRATLLMKENIDIKRFSKLLSFLKRKRRGYKAKKCKAFTKEDIIKFLRDAPDEIYLMKKVFFIIGITGGCRRKELAYLETDNIQDVGSALLITLKDTRTQTQRNFTVINKQESHFPNMLNIYRKYICLRPPHINHKRLFIHYIRGKCTTQVVGINTIAKIPSQIAKYLNLPDPSDYTANSLRRTSSALSP